MGVLGAPRVAFVSTYPPTHCGVGEYTHLLASSLASVEPGVEVVVLADRNGDGGRGGSRAAGEVVPAFERGRPESLGGILDALQEVGGADVLHVQHEYGIFGRSDRILSVALEAKRERLAGAVVFTLHTVVHSSVDGRLAGFQEALLGEADYVVVHSNVQEYELQTLASSYPRNIARIPHGTSLNPYLDEPRPRLARALGLSAGMLRGAIVSVIGFIRRDKGVDTLLEALEILDGTPRPPREATVLVAGEPRDEGLVGLLRGREGRGLVLLPRYLSTREILMAAALSDVIVLPYKDRPGVYSVSGILHLSMGSLKPVVGSNAPRLAELYTLTPRLTFRAGDAGELAGLLRSLLDPEYYELAVAYASPLYSYAVRTSWPRMARRHLRLYNRLLRR